MMHSSNYADTGTFGQGVYGVTQPGATTFEGSSYGEYHESHAEIKIPKFSAEDAKATFQTSEYFKWHTYGAVALSAAAFVGWLIGSFITPMWPWFTYIWGASLLSMSAHFYLFERPKRELLQFHFMVFAVANTLAFCSWIFAHQYGHSWYIEVFFATSLALSLHYTWTVFADNENKWMIMHMTAFVLVNLFLFTLWLDISKGIPWFLYTLFISATLLNVHWQVHRKQGDYVFKMHLGLYGFVNLMLFFTWAIFSMGFPWFAFPLVIWGVVLALHHSYGAKLTIFAPSRADLPTSGQYALGITK